MKEKGKKSKKTSSEEVIDTESMATSQEVPSQTTNQMQDNQMQEETNMPDSNVTTDNTENPMSENTMVEKYPWLAEGLEDDVRFSLAFAARKRFIAGWEAAQEAVIAARVHLTQALDARAGLIEEAEAINRGYIMVGAKPQLGIPVLEDVSTTSTQPAEATPRTRRPAPTAEAVLGAMVQGQWYTIPCLANLLNSSDSTTAEVLRDMLEAGKVQKVTRAEALERKYTICGTPTARSALYALP